MFKDAESSIGLDLLPTGQRVEKLYADWAEAGLVESNIEEIGVLPEDLFRQISRIGKVAARDRVFFARRGVLSPDLSADLDRYLESLSVGKKLVEEGKPVRFGLPVVFPYLVNPEPKKDSNVKLCEESVPMFVLNSDYYSSISARMEFQDEFFDLPPEESFEIYRYVSGQFWRFHLNMGLFLATAKEGAFDGAAQYWQNTRRAMICLYNCGAVKFDRSSLGNFAGNLVEGIDEAQFSDAKPCIDFKVDEVVFHFQVLQMLDMIMRGFDGYRGVGMSWHLLFDPVQRKELYEKVEKRSAAFQELPMPFVALLDLVILSPGANSVFGSLGTADIQGSKVIQSIEEVLVKHGLESYQAGSERVNVGREAKAVVEKREEFSFLDLQKYVLGRFKQAKGRATDRYRRRWLRDADDAIYDCDHRASIVMGEFSGAVKTEGSGHFKSVWIERRDPLEIAYPSNLTCRGILTMKLRGREERKMELDFEISGNGEVFFIVEGKKYDRQGFEATRQPAMVNFYVEASARVLVALKSILVREERLTVSNALSDAGLCSDEASFVELTSRFSLSPRIENLVGSTSSAGASSEQSEMGLQKMISALMDKIRNAEEIRPDELEGLIIYKRGEELDLDGETANMYIPLDPLPVLRLAVEGRIDLAEYFVMISRDRTVRAGYNPNRIEDGVMTCVQNKPSDYSEALRTHIEERFKVRFADDVADVTSIGIPEVDGERLLHEIHTIRIGTRKALEEGELVELGIEDIRSWVMGGELIDLVHSVVVENEGGVVLVKHSGDYEGDEDFRVKRVQFNAPQNVQFVRATYCSLRELIGA